MRMPLSPRGQTNARRGRFVDAPGSIDARAQDWHSRACKTGPLSRGAHQAVAAGIALFLGQRGIVARWEAGGVIPAHGGRRCDLLALLPDGALAIDVACCDVEVGATARSGWELLARRERGKIEAYAGLRHGVRFAPLVVDGCDRLVGGAADGGGGRHRHRCGTSYHAR